MIAGVGREPFTGPHIGPAPFGKVKTDPGRVDFGSMLKGFVGDVNHLQNVASSAQQKFLAGEIRDVHQVMLAAGEAKMALNLLIEVRNKVMEAYTEIMNVRV